MISEENEWKNKRIIENKLFILLPIVFNDWNLAFILTHSGLLVLMFVSIMYLPTFFLKANKHK